MAPDADRPEEHDALVNVVRHGDILLFNGWYSGDKIKNYRKKRSSVL